VNVSGTTRVVLPESIDKYRYEVSNSGPISGDRAWKRLSIENENTFLIYGASK
jgi:hypothetical protein